jgi:hypothetical protein
MEYAIFLIFVIFFVTHFESLLAVDAFIFERLVALAVYLFYKLSLSATSFSPYYCLSLSGNSSKEANLSSNSRKNE